MEFKKILKPRRLYEDPERTDEYLPISNLKQYLQEHSCVAPQGKDFKPTCYYNRDGDGFEIYFKDDDCYAEDLGNLVLMRSEATNEVVGIQVWGIKHLMGLIEIKPEILKGKSEVTT